MAVGYGRGCELRYRWGMIVHRREAPYIGTQRARIGDALYIRWLVGHRNRCSVEKEF